MADTIAEMPFNANPIPKGRRKNRKALTEKDSSTNEANILAAKICNFSPTLVPPPSDDVAKENHECLSLPRLPKKAKALSKAKQPKQSFEKDLQDMQEKLQKLTLEKKKTEELLKTRDEMLKLKEDELETRDREKEKLQAELKKLQKLKEFKPTMIFTSMETMRNKEQEKNKKKNGCPEKKRPAPAYVLWCKDQWTEVKKANPDAEFKEISNILGTKWKNISSEEKQPYEEKYQAEKEAYLQIVGKEKRQNEAMKLLEEEQKQKTAMELLEQYLQFKQEAEKEKKKTRKEKDPLKPKHPMSAFFVFSKERRPALLAENKRVAEVSKTLGEEWRNMTEEQKVPYEEMAKKNKENYQQEIEIYKQKKEEEFVNLKMEEDEQMKIKKQEALQLLKKKEKAENIIKKTKENRQKRKEMRKNADPNKPRRPASSFLLFGKEARKNLLEERQGINNSTINALISVKWKELGEQEKKVWNDKAAEAMEAYKKEMEAYNLAAAAAETKDGDKSQQKLRMVINQAMEPNKPRRPASSFLLFSKEARKNLSEERQGINNSTINALISVKWKELGEQEKKVWNDKAAEAMEAYKKEMEAYNLAAAAAKTKDGDKSQQ